MLYEPYRPKSLPEADRRCSPVGLILITDGGSAPSSAMLDLRHPHSSEGGKHLRLHDITEGLHGLPPGIGKQTAGVARQSQGRFLVAHQFRDDAGVTARVIGFNSTYRVSHGPTIAVIASQRYYPMCRT